MARAAPRGDRLSFQPAHALLNPHFEHYKLAPPPAPPASFPLPTPFCPPSVPDHARLSYNEVAARARHNHLAAGHAGELVFVDRDGAVTALHLDPKTVEPVLHPLLRLPSPPSSSAAVPEYPTAHSVAPFLWLVSDGRGSLHLVRIKPFPPPWSAAVEASFVLREPPDDDAEPTPFRFHAAEKLSDDDALVLLSIVSKAAPSPAPAPPQPSSSSSTARLAATTRHTIASSTQFTYLCAHVPLRAPPPAVAPQPLAISWRLQCADLPSFVHWDPARRAFAIGAGSKVVHPPSSASSGATEAGFDIPEVEDVDMTDADVSAPSTTAAGAQGPVAPRPPPFSWMQDSDSVTVAFPLPSDTPTAAIRIVFSRQFLSLHVASSSSFSDAPRVSHKRLWDAIDPHTSVWTFDRDAEGRDSTFGLLTLHLEKTHPGTRWSDVFAASVPAEVSEGDGGAARIEELDPEAEYERVPETLDPSELAAISERMEQWAQSVLSSGRRAAAPGGGGGREDDVPSLGSGIPTSLVGDEVDVEVDAESGRPFVVTWIEDAADAEAHERLLRPTLVHPHANVPFELLSTPFPLAALRPSDADDDEVTAGATTTTLAIKHDVDGLVFSAPAPSSSSTDTSLEWTHTATLPALAFVLATKRDTRFVYHLARPSVVSPSRSAGLAFAFDAPALLPGPAPSSATSGAGGGNCFVYIAPPAVPRGGARGTQLVLRVGQPGAGPLLGVAAVEVARGGEGSEKEVVVVALCEREVCVLRVL
ncbi:NudC domain-containing protein [Rhodotorula paludigena]|uniref:NudC domain-containing protein n=1 Tax=Rhodotorula paludigena TaxID=86838 RepID=UPI003171431F